MFISDPRPSQEEADEMVWHNNLLEAATTPAVTATTGFPPPSHNGLDGLDHDWNKSVNLEDFCQTAQANDDATAPSFHHIHHNPQFDQPSSHMDMDMDMMTSFNTSFDTMSASSPSVGATWSESSPEYETCRQHEGHGNSSTSSSFHRPSAESNISNDAQSFSPTSDASWGSSPAPIQGSYMDLSDTTATTTTSASIASPNSSSMSAYPGQQQHQSTELSQHLSDASACLQGTVETDTLFNNAGNGAHPQHQQTLSDFSVVWTSAPSSSQPSITSASSSFVSPHQPEPRWHQYSVSAEPMLDEPRLTSSSLSLDNMSEGGLSTMPSSPIHPFHNGGATGHHSLVCDGLPSPTHSSFGRSSANGGVSLQHQHHQQQYPSVMLNGGQLAAGGVPFDSGNNFSHHPSSSPSGTGGGDILFRGPISHRTVFDYPSSGPTHFDQDTNVALKPEGPLVVSPGSLWLNNHQHKTPTPHPSPESSPIGAHTYFQQNQMPLPLDFGNNAVQFGSGHINTSQLHPHYVQQQQQSRAQRKSLPHSPPHRMGSGGGGGRPPSPRYNPGVMTTREMLPSHPNSPSMSWAHHQGHFNGLPHHHQLMMKPNTVPSHHPSHHPQHLSSMSRRQQPFHHTQHHGAHPYHPSSSSNNNKRRSQGHHQDNATDHLKRARAEQDALLVRLRKQGKSYKQIRQLGRFTEAESTLRGRYRTLTKSREQRVRKPEWTDKDLRLLEQAVRTLAKGPLSVTYSNPSNPSNPPKNSSSSVSSSSTTTHVGETMSITSLVSTTSRGSSKSSKSSTTTTSPNQSTSTTPSASTSNQPQSSQVQPKGIPTTTTKIPWKQVAHYIVSHGGSYKFGNATVRKRWEELMRDQLARGKDLQKPFWEQRSKRSPYHLLSQSSQSVSSSSFAASRASQVQRRQSQLKAAPADADADAGVDVKRVAAAAAAGGGQVKSERGEEGNEDGNLAYSDWLDMSALGDDADENNDNDGDADGDYDLSDASDSEEEEEEEEDADSDDDYMEE